MKAWIAALVVAIIAAFMPTPSHAQDFTPAPTPAISPSVAPTASPDASFTRSKALPEPPGDRVSVDHYTFEGGVQVGTTAAGASAITFIKRVKCTIDPIALAGGGSTQNYQCAATGALAGDFATCSLPIGSASGVVIKSVATGTNYVAFAITGVSSNFLDVGAVDIQCLVVR